MSKVWRLVRWTVAGCLLLAQPLTAAEGLRGNLVDVKWLARNLASPDVLILDASPAQMYTAKHIPGAVNASAAMVNTPYGLQDMPASEIEALYRSAGIVNGTRIVMYDQGGTMLATRLFFSLLYHGLPATDLFILDGGLSKWQEAGLRVTNDPAPRRTTGAFRINQANVGIRAGLTEFLAASGDRANNALVEALGAGWHFGEVRAFDRAGHIPGGVLLPSDDFFNADKTFKSAEEIGRMLAYLGIRRDQQVYTYCGGGIAASVPFFAIRFIANYPNAKLFTASELGWLADDRELPYWTYDAPFLLRDATWLQAWGGQMMRMYAGSQVSVIDVRPAAAFSQGHVPLSLNIPADVFVRHLADPAKLADVLGPAGVDASHEAVVVSGAAVTKDAALAFAMLEKLGQKRVSILIDSMDEWTRRGFSVTTDATLVRPRQSSLDTAVAPTIYPINLRKGIVIADPASTQGLYPKVFIASGKGLPARGQAGRIVHVPYTDLLNADGTPKAAKDIWNILVKAGVPRYAELVCVSDDPGEAAVDYFILKLMGFPDVKVLS